ncbi:predicted protein [Uncinocarpus reesii 1704]|uniref:F-box domain-containing protein n=1 Tax=Uncinocarpus reesii (strain UAMH 1704) TaxID=336963 RepID=C4JN79_UNCRE|nr:uncharacterized protein UREG_04285 [Uncinocarpus reesii 1704]EEP79439.1 predicted protein [Uncinocarpus reesii 1704]
MPLPKLTSHILLKFPCSICGFIIIARPDIPTLFANLERHGVSCNAPSEWLSDLRAFHPHEPFLTGVGRNLGPGDILDGSHAPSDPAKSCDDGDYQDSDRISFKIRLPPHYQPGPLDVGYPIHHACWQLLHRQAQLQGIEDLTDARYTDFLFQLHNSTLDGTGQVWSGDYGGLLGPAGEIRISTAYDACFNPFDIGAVTAFIKRARAKMVPRMQERPVFGRERKSRELACLFRSLDPLGSKPCFDALPLEIIYLVMEQLSVRDILNFWIASPSVPDFFPQRFWRSRFELGMEFGHLFEFRDLWHNQDVHWYTLFWKARDLLSSPEVGTPIRNRRRILPVADRTIELASKYVDCPVEGDEGEPLDPILLETDGFSAHRMRLSLPSPDQIKALHISTVQVGCQQYISGLRLNDSRTGLGYYHGSTSKSFQIDTSLRGPVREIICFTDYMGATKLIALGVDTPLTAPQDSRSHVLWRSRLPPDNVTVDLERHMYHKILRPRQTPWNIRYNPVHYHVFDTRDSLTGITGYVLHLNWNLVGLEFSYEEGNNPNATPNIISFGEKRGTPMHFPVDGAGGEHITGLTITTMSAGPLAPVVSLTTNRGRSTWFSVKKSLVDVPQKYVHESHYTPGPDSFGSPMLSLPVPSVEDYDLLLPLISWFFYSINRPQTPLVSLIRLQRCRFKPVVSFERAPGRSYGKKLEMLIWVYENQKQPNSGKHDNGYYVNSQQPPKDGSPKYCDLIVSAKAAHRKKVRLIVVEAKRLKIYQSQSQIAALEAQLRDYCNYALEDLDLDAGPMVYGLAVTGTRGRMFTLSLGEELRPMLAGFALGAGPDGNGYRDAEENIWNEAFLLVKAMPSTGALAKPL